MKDYELTLRVSDVAKPKDPQGMKEAVALALERFGHVDVLSVKELQRWCSGQMRIGGDAG